MIKPALWMLGAFLMLSVELIVLNSHIPGRVPWGIAAAVAAVGMWLAGVLTMARYAARIRPIRPSDTQEDFDDDDPSR